MRLGLHTDVELTFTPMISSLAVLIVLTVLLVVVGTLALLPIHICAIISLRLGIPVHDLLATVDIVWPVTDLVQGIENSAGPTVLNVGRSIGTIQELVAVDGVLNEARVPPWTLDLWLRLCLCGIGEATPTRDWRRIVQILSLGHTIDMRRFQSGGRRGIINRSTFRFGREIALTCLRVENRARTTTLDVAPALPAIQELPAVHDVRELPRSLRRTLCSILNHIVVYIVEFVECVLAINDDWRGCCGWLAIRRKLIEILTNIDPGRWGSLEHGLRLLLLLLFPNLCLIIA